MSLPTKKLQPHKIYQDATLSEKGFRVLCRVLVVAWATASLYFIPTLIMKVNAAQQSSTKFQVAAAMCNARPVSYLIEAGSPSEAAAKLKVYEDAITGERAALTAAAALERRKTS